MNLATKWTKIALFNLLMVAILGLILRYKIAFSIPFLIHKHLLDGHFHFAFNGWVSQMIMILLITSLPDLKVNNKVKKYEKILMVNFIFSYLILFSFLIDGYSMISEFLIICSSVLFYLFGLQFWKDINRIENKSINHIYFKAAIVFNLISSIGVFTLFFLMNQNTTHQKSYLLSVYFYLHFQYNGLFIFSCLGLFFTMLQKHQIKIKHDKIIFWILAITVIPSYFLSALWMKLPGFITALIILSTIIQLLTWSWLMYCICLEKRKILRLFSKLEITLLSISAFSMTAKVSLQSVSLIPSLSQFAFGFRPVVVGYLHLVFLGIVTTFLIAYALHNDFIKKNNATKQGLYIFSAGIILNEIILMTQGFSFMSYIVLPLGDEMLLAAVLVMVSGALILIQSQRKTSIIIDKSDGLTFDKS